MVLHIMVMARANHMRVVTGCPSHTQHALPKRNPRARAPQEPLSIWSNATCSPPEASAITFVIAGRHVRLPCQRTNVPTWKNQAVYCSKLPSTLTCSPSAAAHNRPIGPENNLCNRFMAVKPFRDRPFRNCLRPSRVIERHCKGGTPLTHGTQRVHSSQTYCERDPWR